MDWINSEAVKRPSMSLGYDLKDGTILADSPQPITEYLYKENTAEDTSVANGNHRLEEIRVGYGTSEPPTTRLDRKVGYDSWARVNYICTGVNTCTGEATADFVISRGPVDEFNNFSVDVTDQRLLVDRITRYQFEGRDHTGVTEDLGGSHERSTSFEYDNFGQVTKTIYPDGRCQEMTYYINNPIIIRESTKESCEDPNSTTLDLVTRVWYDPIVNVPVAITGPSGFRKVIFQPITTRIFRRGYSIQSSLISMCMKVMTQKK